MMSSLQKSSLPLDERLCIDLVNRLIIQSNLQTKEVHSANDIQSGLITSLFQKITGRCIPDLITSSDKSEEDIHNIQCVIDALSLDVLGISLSHISGEAVVAGNLVALHNLLEILEATVFFLETHEERVKIFPLKRKTCRKTTTSSASHKSSSISSHGRIFSQKKDDKDKRVVTESSPFSTTTYPQMVKKKRLKKTTRTVKITSKKDSESGLATSQYRVSRNISEDKNIKKESTEDEVDTSVSSRNNKQHNLDETSSIRTSASSSSYKSKPKHIKTERKTTKLVVKWPKSAEQEIENLYDVNFENKLQGILENNTFYKSRASYVKRLQHQTIKKPACKRPIPPCNKSYLLPYPLRKSSRDCKIKTHTLKNPLKVSPPHRKITVEAKSNLIQKLTNEFPNLKLSPVLVKRLTSKYEGHLLNVHKKFKQCLLKKSKRQTQLEEAVERQSAMSKLIDKDIKEQRYLREIQEHKMYESKTKNMLRNARLQSAKMKEYYKDFRDDIQKRSHKNKSDAEVNFEKAFTNALNAQQNEVFKICQEVNETGEIDAQQHLKYLDALGNLYMTQYSELAEILDAETRDEVVRVKAQAQAQEQEKREFREHLKKEIQEMQKIILELTSEK